MNDRAAGLALTVCRTKFVHRLADSQTLVLLACAACAEGIRFTEVMRKTGLAKSTAASALHRLKVIGDVKEVQGPRIRSSIGPDYCLTEQGRELVEKLTDGLVVVAVPRAPVRKRKKVEGLWRQLIFKMKGVSDE